MKNKFKSDGCTGVPEFIFKPACKIHDEDYFYKKGRLKSDNRFLFNMLDEIEKTKKTLSAEEIIRYERIAHSYYYGVRCFGWFYYYIKPIFKGRNM